MSRWGDEKVSATTIVIGATKFSFVPTPDGVLKLLFKSQHKQNIS